MSPDDEQGPDEPGEPPVASDQSAPTDPEGVPPDADAPEVELAAEPDMSLPATATDPVDGAPPGPDSELTGQTPPTAASDVPPTSDETGSTEDAENDDAPSTPGGPPVPLTDGTVDTGDTTTWPPPSGANTVGGIAPDDGYSPIPTIDGTTDDDADLLTGSDSTTSAYLPLLTEPTGVVGNDMNSLAGEETEPAPPPPTVDLAVATDPGLIARALDTGTTSGGVAELRATTSPALNVVDGTTDPDLLLAAAYSGSPEMVPSPALELGAAGTTADGTGPSTDVASLLPGTTGTVPTSADGTTGDGGQALLTLPDGAVLTTAGTAFDPERLQEGVTPLRTFTTDDLTTGGGSTADSGAYATSTSDPNRLLGPQGPLATGLIATVGQVIATGSSDPLRTFAGNAASTTVGTLIGDATGSRTAGTTTAATLREVLVPLANGQDIDPRRVAAATAGSTTASLLRDTDAAPVAGTAATLVQQLVANGEVDPEALASKAIDELLPQVLPGDAAGAVPLLGTVLKGFVTGDMDENDVTSSIVATGAVAAGLPLGVAAPVGIAGAYILDQIFNFSRDSAARDARHERDDAIAELSVLSRRDADRGTDPTTRQPYVDSQGRRYLDRRTGQVYLDPRTGTEVNFNRPFLLPEQVYDSNLAVIAPDIREQLRQEDREATRQRALAYYRSEDPNLEWGQVAPATDVDPGSAEHFRGLARLAERNQQAAAVDPDHVRAELSPLELTTMANFTARSNEVLEIVRTLPTPPSEDTGSQLPPVTTGMSVYGGNMGGDVQVDADWVRAIRRETPGPYQDALREARRLRDGGSPLYTQLVADLQRQVEAIPPRDDTPPPRDAAIVGELYNDVLRGGLDDPNIGTPDVVAQAQAITASRTGLNEVAAAYDANVTQPCVGNEAGVLGCDQLIREYLHPASPALVPALQPDTIDAFRRVQGWENRRRAIMDSDPRPLEWFLTVERRDTTG
ncbi:MAG: hypothetical protein H7Y15_04065 [Pseudonocardia sp.]|nr:hypothetical protein [Pseudonocardia sp.]